MCFRAGPFPALTPFSTSRVRNRCTSPTRPLAPHPAWRRSGPLRRRSLTIARARCGARGAPPRTRTWPTTPARIAEGRYTLTAARCLSHQPFQAYLSCTVAQDGAETQLKMFCDLGIASRHRTAQGPRRTLTSENFIPLGTWVNSPIMYFGLIARLSLSTRMSA